jgi:hypothetical protein
MTSRDDRNLIVLAKLANVPECVVEITGGTAAAAAGVEILFRLQLHLVDGTTVELPVEQHDLRHLIAHLQRVIEVADSHVNRPALPAGRGLLN